MKMIPSTEERIKALSLPKMYILNFKIKNLTSKEMMKMIPSTEERIKALSLPKMYILKFKIKNLTSEETMKMIPAAVENGERERDAFLWLIHFCLICKIARSLFFRFRLIDYVFLFCLVMFWLMRCFTLLDYCLLYVSLFGQQLQFSLFQQVYDLILLNFSFSFFTFTYFLLVIQETI
ncbi:hypothetical protein LINGRAHAP2_LOCUS30679 [Linum grandiflorum]